MGMCTSIPRQALHVGNFHVVAAHIEGGDGSEAFLNPKTVMQAMECEDSEYWKAAMLDELTNHEEVFQSFGPPIPRSPGIKAT